ncbi:DUF4013 domain-containing protein [Chryseobacterium indologenes]|uniref:DUF4013 domain-containing protein n=1 Tax=Chryseobacterium indologenes TaxID=253 RepID=A0A5R9PVS8_CHRID|nr:DUF4013 domain-containing protein [Chryseobacterium indologenes]ASE63730.1 DUF4013 domain-containing protein [Chryseobacterium indologenes]ATN07735.1 DUF4013 domain-containing protein [Chryseobacterium indologenes]AYY83525.1 DUF4013 domain-containing protein [Chryseobacterium indologenes]AZB19446.1 DUF4013 domain-containing protein [Chryseobacterium indologenes]QIX80441.1 DUF4013 domain-containing protein [Chryseobacterium indologenes]
MIQFYKKRDFGTFISDSFNFFKLYGKNYFKNYILINGLLLILAAVVVIFGFREIFGQLLGPNMSGETYYFEKYFSENTGMLVVVSVLMFILLMLIAIINYLYPVFYLKRIAHGAEKVKTDEILDDFKKNSGRIGKLCLGMIFIVAPLVLFVVGFSYLLVLIIIGFFLILLLYPTIFNCTTFLMYDYFNSSRGFLESLSYSIRSQFSYTNGSEKSPFWKYWASSFVMFIIIYIATTIFTLVPMIFFYGSILTSTPDASFEENPFTGAMGIAMFIFYGISMILSFFLSNLMYVNAGIMYYDSRTDLHQKAELAEIDTIGINE